MNHIIVSKYIYYRQDDVRLATAHQIESRVAMSEDPFRASYLKQTNKHKTSLIIGNFRFMKKNCFREEDRGFFGAKMTITIPSLNE